MSEFFGKGNNDALSENLKYVWQRCIENEPNDRISHDEIIIYLRALAKSCSYLSAICI